MKKTIVINLYAGSGAGKSVTAAELYAYMSKEGFGSVELVREYAKDLVWCNDMKTLSNQKKVTKEQIRRQDILLGSVDFIVTDSPVELGLIYGKKKYKKVVSDMIKKHTEKYETINFFLLRNDKFFVQKGRIHSLKESKKNDERIISLLENIDEKFFVVPSENRIEFILSVLSTIKNGKEL